MGLTMGAMLIGVLIATMLYGVSIVQTYIYFCIKSPEIPREREDSWFLKTLVAAVFLCDTVHQILISHTSAHAFLSLTAFAHFTSRASVYTYVITEYGKPTTLNEAVWSLLAEVLFNGLSGFLAQSFYALRVWRCMLIFNFRLLDNATTLTLFYGPFSLFCEFGSITAFGIKALVSVKTFTDLAHMKRLSVLVNALAAAGDIYIAAVLTILLYKSKTGFRRSDAMITRLMVFAINTGLLTALCAIGSLVSICVAPTTFLYIGFFFVIGRLYANSLLCALNARSYIRSTCEAYNSTEAIENMFTSRDTGISRPSQRSRFSIHIHTLHQRDTNRDLKKGTRGQGPEEVAMSPIEHRHRTSFCDQDNSANIAKQSTNQPPPCLVRQHQVPRNGV
ncbi:hypothetical protein V5O48_016757 [Marasmius crinis-equi]|uniref:DUF6534 domain-containing protein n=1 Tax=Marasmius crinis-equi TaxID=585013 RepID=A0ABR3EQU1_9AGAR